MAEKVHQNGGINISGYILYWNVMMYLLCLFISMNV